MDENYWEEQYKNTWPKSTAREERLAAYIKTLTGRTCKEYGLGAGTTQFIPGSAKRNGRQKGDADMWVQGTNIYVEVTGPLVKTVSSSSPLWFRPDKINNAIKNPGHDVFLAHNFASDDTWRVIHIDQEFKVRFRNHEFQVVNPVIRGTRERYIQIEVRDHCIRNLYYLIKYINCLGEITDNGKNET